MLKKDFAGNLSEHEGLWSEQTDQMKEDNTTNLETAGFKVKKTMVG